MRMNKHIPEVYRVVFITHTGSIGRRLCCRTGDDHRLGYAFYPFLRPWVVHPFTNYIFLRLKPESSYQVGLSNGIET